MPDERSIPEVPSDPADKHGWHRRFTWNVQAELQAKEGQKPLTPAEAGARAKQRTRQEFQAAHPGKEVPSFLP